MRRIILPGLLSIAFVAAPPAAAQIDFFGPGLSGLPDGFVGLGDGETIGQTFTTPGSTDIFLSAISARGDANCFFAAAEDCPVTFSRQVQLTLFEWDELTTTKGLQLASSTALFFEAFSSPTFTLGVPLTAKRQLPLRVEPGPGSAPGLQRGRVRRHALRRPVRRRADDRRPDRDVSFVGHYQVVPEPVTLLLFGSGMVGVAGLHRRRRGTLAAA
jgi:hypothetical protein